MASKKKPRESLVMGPKKKKKATKKKAAKKRRSTRAKPKPKPAPIGSTLRGFKPLVFGTEPPPDTLPAREDERPEYSP